MSDETSLRTIQLLTPEEKMDLVTGQDNRVVQILFRVMENEVIAARDIAAEMEPSDPKRISRLDEAHFINKFYRNIREVVRASVDDLHNRAKQVAVEADLADPDKVLEIMLNQTAHINLV